MKSLPALRAVLFAGLLGAAQPAPAQETFIRGDANSDGLCNRRCDLICHICSLSAMFPPVSAPVR